MATPISLKEIEKKTYTDFFKDGLYEILFAHIMLTGMLSSILNENGVSDIIRASIYVPVMFLGILIVYLGKRHITTPRLGTVKFATERKRKIRKLHIITFIFVALTFYLAVSAMTANLNRNLPVSFLIPLFLFSFFAIAAWYKDYPRLYIIGFFYAISEVIYVFLENKGIVMGRGLLAYGVPGLMILIMGILSLFKFLKKYPKIEIGAPNE